MVAIISTVVNSPSQSTHGLQASFVIVPTLASYKLVNERLIAVSMLQSQTVYNVNEKGEGGEYFWSLEDVWMYNERKNSNVSSIPESKNSLSV